MRSALWSGMFLALATSALMAMDHPGSSSPQVVESFGSPLPMVPMPRVSKEMNLQEFIDTRVKAGARQIVIPPGSYRVKPHRGSHLRLEKLSDIEIIADGVEMICTETSNAITFSECKNVRFRGMIIDFDPLTFTQGTITAMAPDKSWIEFAIHGGYPEHCLADRVEIYDPKTMELRRETTGWNGKFESVGPHRYRVGKREGYRYNPTSDTEMLGDYLVTAHEYPAKTGGHAISIGDCKDLQLTDITLYGSSCFGFIEHNSDGSVYQRCRIDRRRPADDLVVREVPRLRSLTADAYHSVGAVRGPIYRQCVAKFQGDDCVNIHGTYQFILAVDQDSLRVANTGRFHLQSGEAVEFLPVSGLRPADARILSITPDGLVNDAERDMLKPLHMNANNKKALLDPKTKVMRVKLDRAVTLEPGSLLCSSSRVGNGFRVEDCDFGFNRSRGILIKASDGRVTGNRISGGWMAAILVAPEFWWFEAASSSNLVIEKNFIIGCRRPAIEVLATGAKGAILEAGAHRNLVIAKNRIEGSVWPNIHVQATSELQLVDNQLTAQNPELSPPVNSPWRFGKEPPTDTVLQNCQK